MKAFLAKSEDDIRKYETDFIKELIRVSKDDKEKTIYENNNKRDAGCKLILLKN